MGLSVDGRYLGSSFAAVVRRGIAMLLKSPLAARSHFPVDGDPCLLAQSDGAWFDAFPPHRRFELSTQ
jgi:hypothetical protein